MTTGDPVAGSSQVLFWSNNWADINFVKIVLDKLYL